MCELSPWLLLGMVLSGALHVLLPGNFVRRRFRGFGGVVQSVLLGVPLPLCSCGVIPAGIGLKNDGASDGASVGFLISTPQTGVDSVLVSASFFGWPFAIFKMIAAAVTGVAGGWITEATTPANNDVAESRTIAASNRHGSEPWFVALWSHAIEVLHSIWVWLLIGVAVSALIGTLGFESYIQQIGNAGLLPAMLLMLVIAIPLYVCATASVPIAAALVQSGLSPAVAIVFLMAGPATNLTTMGAVRGRFGWRVLLIYLATLILGSFAAAFLFDWVLSASVSSSLTHVHHHQTWWSISSAIIVLLLISRMMFQQVRRLGSRVSSTEESVELSVSGMHCGGCVNRIESAIRKLDSVDSVRIDLGSGKAFVGGGIKAEKIKSVIEELGFQVE